MTANVTFGNNFNGVIAYNSEKIDAKNGLNHSELLEYFNVAPELKLVNKRLVPVHKSIAKDMKNHADSFSTRVKKPVMHTSFSFPPSEKIDKEKMMKASLLALKEVGISSDDFQMVAYQHKDKEHPHLHFVINRVDLSGEVHKNEWIANRLQVACSKVEQEMNLKVTPNRIFTYDESNEKGYKVQTNSNIKLRNTKKKGVKDAQEQVKNTFDKLLKNAVIIDEISIGMMWEGIHMKKHTNKNGLYGLSFQVGDIKIKASQLGIKIKDVKAKIKANLTKCEQEIKRTQPKEKNTSSSTRQQQPEIKKQRVKAENKAKTHTPPTRKPQPIKLSDAQAMKIYESLRYGGNTNQFVKNNIHLISKIFDPTNVKSNGYNKFNGFAGGNTYPQELEQLKSNYVAFIKAQNQQLAKWIDENKLDKALGDDLKYTYGAFSEFIRKAQYTNKAEYRALQEMLGKPIAREQSEQTEQQTEQQKIRRRR